MRGCKPFRTVVANFNVLPGKYSVIPLVHNFADPSASRYSLRLYFNCEPDKIKFHSEEPCIRVLEYLQQNAMGSSGRNPAFSAGEGSHAGVARNAFARKVMVPYSLDAVINVVKPKKKGASTSGVTTVEQTIAAAKKQFETKNVFYEDNAKGASSAQSHKLVSAEQMQMSEQSRQ